ncbi:hypothetical protein [Cellulomonas sp. Marseille-Q8402]
MSADVRVQLRRYRGAFAGAAALLVAGGSASLVWHDVELVAIVWSLVQMLVWCFVVAYVAHEIFRHLHDGDDYLLQSAPLGPRRSVMLRAVVFFVYLTGLFLIGLVVWRSSLALESIGVSVGGLGYYIVTRVVSIAAFLALICALVVAAKSVRRRFPALVAVFVIFFAVVIALATVVVTTVQAHDPGAAWGLGVDTTFHGINQYVTILPLIVRPSGPFPIESTFYPLTLWLNVGVGTLSLGLWYVLGRRRHNFI